MCTTTENEEAKRKNKKFVKILFLLTAAGSPMVPRPEIQTRQISRCKKVKTRKIKKENGPKPVLKL